MTRFGIVYTLAANLILAGPALAESVKTELAQNGAAEVVVYLHPFLSQEDLTMLRLVQSNAQALALFVPEGQGFAAIAAAPQDGFFREGQPVPSARAIAQVADLARAKAKALAACDQLRRGKAACEVILTVAPRN